MQKKILLTTGMFLIEALCFAQDKVETHTLNYDPDRLKIIPDKVFEFGIPLLFIFLLLNTIVSILKNRAEHQLKLKMLEKGISDETLLKIFKESNVITKLQPLKWFLFSLASAVSLLAIHFSRNYLLNQSGYLAVGILLFFISIAFFIYYNILKNKQ